MKNKMILTLTLVFIISISGMTNQIYTDYPQTPKETIETYFGKVTGPFKDYEGAYEMLSIEVRHHGDLNEYKRQIKHFESLRPRAEYKITDIKYIERKSDYAAINLTTRAIGPRITSTSSREINLYKEEGKWKVFQRFHPEGFQ